MKLLMNSHLLLILTSIYLFAACKKSGKENSPGSLRIRTVTNSGVVTNYSYDDQFRLIRSEADQAFFKEEYQYEPGRITWTLTEPSQTYRVFYTIGDDGYKKSSQFENSTEISYYENNDQGYTTRTYNNKVPATETTYYYNAGTGLPDSMRTMTGQKWISTSVMMFYTDKTSTINEENFGRIFQGNYAVHPIKSIAVRRPEGNGITVSVTNYTYTYDNQDRIISRSFTTSGGQSGSESYTYY
jgi:YD repeat-containing protein